MSEFCYIVKFLLVGFGIFQSFPWSYLSIPISIPVYYTNYSFMLNNKQLLSATCYNNIIAIEEINAKLKIVFPNNKFFQSILCIHNKERH